MSRVYWDTMLFVFWIEDREPYSTHIASIYNRMAERGDALCSSAFGLAELLVAPVKANNQILEKKIRDLFAGPSVQVLPFDLNAAERFAHIRAGHKAPPADAMHLACASAAGVDLFLTHDKAIRKLVVPGISFIDGIGTSVFGAEESDSS